MKLRSISMKNFRLHADSSFDFEPTGITGIVGSNETGKSTILEGILWALFGGDAIRGTKEGLRWFRAPERSPASVTLVFELKGQKYILVRSETTATLASMMATESTGGSFLAEGTAAVNKFIPELLGMSLNEFTASFMVKQKDVDRIAMMLPTERTIFIREVLGVGKLDEAVKKCRKRKNEIGMEVEGMRAGLGDRQPFVDNLDDVIKVLAESTLESEKVDKEQASLAASGKETHEAFEASLQTYEKKLEIERAISLFKSDVDRTAKLRTHLQFDLDAMDALKKELAEATKFPGLQELKNTGKKITDAGMKASAKVNELRSDRFTESARHVTTLEALKRQVMELDTLIQGIKSIGMEAGCPTCTVPLGDNYQKVLGNLEGQRSEIRLTQNTHVADAKALNVPGDEEHEAEGDAARLIAELHDHSLIVEAAAKRDTELAEIRGKIARKDEIEKELGETDDALKTFIRLAKNQEDAVKDLAFDPKAHEKLSDADTAALKALQDALIVTARVGAEVVAANNLTVKCRDLLKNYDLRCEALADVQAHQLTHEKAAARLADFRTSVAGTIRPELEELMSGFVHILTDGRHEAVELTEDFQAILHEGGIAVEVISGGCEDIAALAMRLSISHMIAERAGHPLSLLILDEPYGSQDDTRRANIVNLLRQLGDVFQQVIVISHVSETKDAADHIIELEFDEFAGKTLVVA